MEDLSKMKADILHRINRAVDFTSGWHNNIQEWRDLYDNNHYKGRKRLSDTEPQYQDPTYTNTVDLANGILLANEMTWKAYGLSPSMPEQKAAEKAEKFLAAVLDVNNSRNEYSIQYEIDNHFSRDGGAVVYTVWSPSIHKYSRENATINDEMGMPVKQRVISEPPVIVRVVDPLAISILPGGPGRWQAVAESTEMFLVDVEEEYADDIEKLYGKARLKPWADLDEERRLEVKDKFVNYWEVRNERGKSVVKNAILFGGEIVRPLETMTGYDSLPYTISFWKPVRRDNSAAWQSILSPLQTTVPWVEKNANRLQHQIDVFSSLPMLSKTDDGRSIQVDPGIGQVVSLKRDEDVGFPVWPGATPDLWRMMDLFRSRVQQSGFSDIMFGGGPSSVSGYALSQMGDQNRIRLEQPIEHLTLLWSWWAKKVLHMAKTFAKSTPICVYGKLKGSNFHDYVKGSDFDGLHVTVQIRPEFPNERVRNHAMATQVKGLLDDSTIIEDYLKYPQPNDIRERKMQEAAQNHPVMQLYAIVSDLAMRAESGDKIAEMTLTYMVNSGQIPGIGPGRPQEPNNPQQPMGTQSPTGQPMNQNQGDVAAGMNQEMGNMQRAAPNMQGGIGG